jgi:hypothetical protein
MNRLRTTTPRSPATTTLLGLALLALTLSSFAAAQAATPPPRPALVPCDPMSEVPCVHIATSVDDIVGVWKQHIGNPMLQAPDGVGYVRYRPDGSTSLAPTVEATAEPFGMYPRGRVSFEGEVMTIEVVGDMVPVECRLATFQVQVVRLGAIPVALFYLPIEDLCMGRLADLRVPLIYVSE